MKTKLPNGGELKQHYTVAEAVDLIEGVNSGSWAASAYFREALLQTDLPLAFDAVTNAGLVPQYAAAESQHQLFTRANTMKDLRPQSYKEIWPTLDNLPETEGGKPRVPGKAPKIGPNNEYPTASLAESTVQTKLDKYGLRLPLTIEDIINDELAILQNYPEAMAIWLRQLEDIVVAESLIADDRSGPRETITHVQGDPILTIESLIAARQQLSEVKVNGILANIQNAALVVPRSLEMQAKAITGIANYDDTATEPGKVFRGVANPVYGMKVVVFDALSTVNLAANASITWFLIADASQLNGRPGVVASKLRGREQPQTFISSPNALTPAGGMADWREGSFRNDSIEFKVRHFFGSAIIFNEGLLVSEPA